MKMFLNKKNLIVLLIVLLLDIIGMTAYIYLGHDRGWLRAATWHERIMAD